MRRDWTRAARGAAAYYNEIDPYAAEWLRNLIAAGHIAAGDVDERSIVDVHPDDLRGYRQCHFFAGIGGWSLALRLAGWPDDRPVWTGSCPCQPFSNAGQRRRTADERHLWPHWFRLIRECRPSVVVGEQVAAAIKHGWLDLVFDDMEAAGYACGAAVLPAGAVGAPHRRERLWFVGRLAHTDGGYAGAERQQRRGEQRLLAQSREPDELAHADSEQRHRRGDAGQGGRSESPDGGAVLGMADASGQRTGRNVGATPRAQTEGCREGRQDGVHRSDEPVACGAVVGVADADDARREPAPGRAAAAGERDPESCGELVYAVRAGLEGHAGDGDETGERTLAARSVAASGGARPAAGHFWSGAQWIECIDGKARLAQPGIFPLAHGVPARVGRLRGYGNAIVPPRAAQFIQASLEAMSDAANR